jgi:hypothetical protein
VASHRDAASLGPEGYPIDWHGVRAFYRVEVRDPAPLAVVEEGGSTDDARWHTVEECAGLALTEVTEDALRAAGLRS